MAIEEDLLRDLYRFMRMIGSRLIRQRQQNRGVSREQELRSLIEELRDLMQQDAQAGSIADQLTPEQRQRLYEREAQRIQEERDRLDNEADPELDRDRDADGPDRDPDDLDGDRQDDTSERRDREEQDRDRTDHDRDGRDDSTERRDEADAQREDRSDVDRDGVEDAVEARAENRAQQDAERQQSEQRGEAEENRGGDGPDVVPAATAEAAAGAAAVAADELEDRLDQDRLEDQAEADHLTDGTSPEVTAESGQDPADRLQQDTPAGPDTGFDAGQDGPHTGPNGSEATQDSPGSEQDGPGAGRDGSEVGQEPLAAQAEGLDADGGQSPETTLGPDGTPGTIAQGMESTGADRNQANQFDAVETQLAADRERHQATTGQNAQATGQNAQINGRNAQANGQSGQVNGQNGQTSGQSGPSGMSPAEIEKLRAATQNGHAPANGATQRTTQPAVAAGHGGRTAGAQHRDMSTRGTGDRGNEGPGPERSRE